MERYLNSRPDVGTTFDQCMLGLAAVFVATITASASILITLPEALEAVSTPAFGAPWITAPVAPSASARRHEAARRHACAAN